MDRGTSILHHTKPNKDDFAKCPCHKFFHIINLIGEENIQIKHFYPTKAQFRGLCPCRIFKPKTCLEFFFTLL